MEQERMIEDLEHAKTRRKVIRIAFTKLVKEIQDILNSEREKSSVKVSFSMLCKKNDELIQLNDKIMNLKIFGKDDKLEEECQTVDSYLRSFLEIQESVRNLNSCIDDEVSVDNFSKRRFKLPKLELRKFDGNVKDWLPFWCQFEKIDSDDSIDPADKFQYLIQSTLKGSRARDVVESFPPTSDNYAKAIECLKSRFGRDDMLVEVYIRELLQLVLKNASAQKPNMSILYDNLESHIRALESLHVTTEKCGAMLYPLVESCLPEDFLRAFSRSSHFVAGTDPKKRLDGLLSFLRSEVESEERINLAMSGFGLKPKIKKQVFANDALPTAAGLLTTSDGSNQDIRICSFCLKQHDTMKCFNAQKMSLSEKLKILKERGCCYRCMTRGHRRDQCRVFVRCIVCSSKGHVTLMCPEVKKSGKGKSGVETIEDSSANAKSESENSLNLASLSRSPKVLLQTLIVKLKGPNSITRVRALIDSGSQKSYILQSTALNMGFRRIREEIISHSLFGGKKTRQEKHNCYKIELGSVQGNFLCNFEVLDEPVICDTISTVIDGPWMDELRNLGISIYDVDKNPGPIQILIGADVVGRLLTGRRKILECNLVAVETLLGWSLMGKLPANNGEEKSAMMVTSLFLKEASITDLWDLDVIGICDPATKKSKEEKEFTIRQQFLDTITTSKEGRYEVSLPWSEDHLPLPSNRNLAVRRLESTTRKLDSEGTFSLYDSALKEWLSLGIIEEVPLDQDVALEHYLPHRPVFKANSTTKIRPVFDASARERLSPSLNQCLESGPNLINLIPALLLKFRELKHGVVADIEKAFLMVSIDPRERDILRFLWWDENRELKIFRHTRVVFGVKCSPFLLASVIEFHLLKLTEESRYDKQILMKLLKSFYVDNVLASFSTRRELNEFMEISQEVMRLASFNLRGWEYTEDVTYSATSVVLGLLWDRNKDMLTINLDWLENLESEKITKRTILSVAHKAFDPIGLLSPVFLLPKLLLQSLWKKGLSWDMEVDESTKREFLSWYKELYFLKEVSVPRWFAYDVDREFSVHTFCDASLHAYAATVFIRVQTPNEVCVHLLASKSRVTPVKTVTIPRLELIAATVGARLCISVLKGLHWENAKLHFWSDSTTVISWIQRNEIWATFVNNRVQEIRQLTEPMSWKHVPGLLNPADLPSRGCSGKQFLLSKWWEGPSWLREPEGKWPLENVIPDEDAILKERKKTSKTETSKCLINQVNSNIDCLEQVENDTLNNDLEWYCKYFSNYDKIVRMMAWIRRFIYNCKKTSPIKLSGELTFQEIDAAEKMLIKLVQTESFTSKENKRLSTLDVFEDEQGLLRLKTKLVFKLDTEDFRCPVILPSDHVVVKRLIMSEHQKNCHAGTQMLLNLLREHYWILNARKAVRSVIFKCVICLRHKQTSLNAPASALPENRTKDASIFQLIGTDLTGPLYLKDGSKAWICLYTCAVYRAVHLELLSSLSTEVFLLSFRRYIARRGRPSIVYCDNGTNFVGASSALKTVDWNQIVSFSSARKIEWIFNPPASPWWGGFWERLIGLVKSLLKKVLGKSHLSYEHLITVLCDAESIINSRPLTYISDNSGELLPLSPSLFLQEVKQVGIPDFDALDSEKLNKRWRYKQKLIAHLRARFRSEYLGMLIQRNQRKKWKSQISIGDIVLIGCENLKRMDWPLGRVIEIIPGKDNISRLVRLQTATSQLLRPIQRVFPLEVSSSWPKERNCEMLIPDVSTPALEVKNEEAVRFSRSGRQIKVPKRLGL